MLFQSSVAWTENSFEEGVVVCRENASAILINAQYTSFEFNRNSDLKKGTMENGKIAISWQRSLTRAKVSAIAQSSSPAIFNVTHPP